MLKSGIELYGGGEYRKYFLGRLAAETFIYNNTGNVA